MLSLFICVMSLAVGKSLKDCILEKINLPHSVLDWTQSLRSFHFCGNGGLASTKSFARKAVFSRGFVRRVQPSCCFV